MGGVVSAIAGGAAKSLVGGLFGGRDESPTRIIQNATPLAIRTPGVFSANSASRVTLTPTPALETQLQNVSNSFLSGASRFGGLLSQVSPGFGRLTEARRGIFNEQRARLDDTRRRVVGDLRDNLARRRVLGSSFAQDTISRGEAEFAKEERALAAEQAEAEARSVLEELEVSSQLVAQEMGARVNAYQTFLDQFRFDAELAANLAGAATSALSANARAQAALAADEASRRGSFFGTIAEPIGAAVRDAVGGIFSGGGVQLDAAGRVLGGI